MTRSSGFNVAALLLFFSLACFAAVALALSAILKTSSIGILCRASNLTLMSSRVVPFFFFFFFRFSASASDSMTASVLAAAWVSVLARAAVYNF